MQATVVIPTYNRLAELRQVLAALAQQQGVDLSRLEVVVVDDGSLDDTWSWLRLQTGRPYRLQAVRQANAGPARARNRGVAGASGELILFLGDDTLPQPDWLVHHLEEHRLHGRDEALAAIGYTGFPPSIDSPFLRWINEFGAQFGYSLITDSRDVPFNFFYTSNVSLPRRFFKDLDGFREDFPAAAWEDIEFSYRATRKGLRLVYQPRARTTHVHPMSPRSFCARQRTSGLSGAIFAGLHRDLGGFLGVPRVRKLGRLAPLEELILLWLVVFGERVHGIVPRRCYRRLLDLAYLRGLARGLARMPKGQPSG